MPSSPGGPALGSPAAGYWPGPWSCEDGGPHRRQVAPAGAELAPGPHGYDVVSRSVPAATMVVTRDADEVFLLRHTAGDAAVCFVERIDPSTLEPLSRSPDLAGGPTWPGSLAVHANGSVYAVFGNHAHRLAPDLSPIASAALGRGRPYNGFVLLPDGHLVTKDFAGARPGRPVPASEREPCELVVLEPDQLVTVARCTLPEPSIARLSADGDDLYVVGDTSLWRLRWDGSLRLDPDFRVPYRTLEGQTYGWDCVLALGAAWFLDNGEGSESYSGTLHGHGVSASPLHLVRVDLETGRCSLTEVCDGPGGLVANPPLIDADRSIAVAYDSGNGVVHAFEVGDDGTLTSRWRRAQQHGGHLVLQPDTGWLVTGDHDPVRAAEQMVLLDIRDGSERARVDTGSPVQGVLFPAATEHGLYLCTFTTVSRISPRWDPGAGT